MVGEINRGLCVLVGIQTDDVDDDMDYIAKKVLSLRLFPDTVSDKPWSKSVMDMGLEVLSISQFTLHAKTNKGTKPDFHNAMKSEDSREFYHNFLNLLRTEYQKEKVQEGRFGERMEVEIINDGPVTIVLDSRAR